jgi:hypothetical protein
VSSAQAATIKAATKTIQTLGYNAEGIGGATYTRISYATITSAAYPAASFFRSIDRFMPDGSTDSTNGGYWLLDAPEVDPRTLGARDDASAPAQAAWNDALDYASKFNPVRPVRSRGGGRYLISSTITMPVQASSLDFDGGTLLAAISDGSALITAPPSVPRLRVRNVLITPVSFDTAGYIAGTSPAQNCIGIDFWHPLQFNPKFDLENVRVRGLAIGMRLDGYTAIASRVMIDFCDLGLEGATLNETTLDIKFEGCRQSYAITVSSGLIFSGGDQGSVANEVPSTIDGGGGINMDGFYWESAAGFGRTVPFLIVGGTTYVNMISLDAGHISASSGLADGVYAIVLDRVNVGDITADAAEGIQGRVFQRTANCKSVNVFYTNDYGFNNDESGIMDAAIEYCPNSQWEGGLKGFQNIVLSNATVALTTSNVRRGKYALRVTAAAGAGNNYVQLRLPAEVVEALRGKTIRFMSAMTVPDTAAFDMSTRTAFPDLRLSSFNGSVSTSESTQSQQILGDATTFAWVEHTIQADATRIELNLFVNNSATLQAGTEAVDFQFVSVVESKVDIRRQLNGECRDSDLLPKFIGGRLRYYDSAAPTDTDQIYGVGDVVETATPAPGTPPRRICTTAGAGGTAVYTPETPLPGLTDRVNQDITLTAGSSRPVQRYGPATAFTADRAVTLSTTGAWEGASFKIVRAAGGAFNLNVGSGPLKALPAGSWCEVTYTGTTWVLTAYGLL